MTPRKTRLIITIFALL